MNEPQEILATEFGRIRDGGTIRYQTRLGIDIYQDGRIGSKTKGLFFDRYPNEDGAKLLNIKVIVIPKEISITK